MALKADDGSHQRLRTRFDIEHPAMFPNGWLLQPSRLSIRSSSETGSEKRFVPSIGRLGVGDVEWT